MTIKLRELSLILKGKGVELKKLLQNDPRALTNIKTQASHGDHSTILAYLSGRAKSDAEETYIAVGGSKLEEELPAAEKMRLSTPLTKQYGLDPDKAKLELSNPRATINYFRSLEQVLERLKPKKPAYAP
jgi:hypothetical protein